MFIPCDKNGDPLEEPNAYKHYKLPGVFGNWNDEILKQCKEYKQALGRVIFKGFYYLAENNGEIEIGCNKKINLYYNKITKQWNGGSYKLISDLCNKVDLTDKEYERLNLRL